MECGGLRPSHGPAAEFEAVRASQDPNTGENGVFVMFSFSMHIYSSSALQHPLINSIFSKTVPFHGELSVTFTDININIQRVVSQLCLIYRKSFYCCC